MDRKIRIQHASRRLTKTEKFTKSLSPSQKLSEPRNKKKIMDSPNASTPSTPDASKTPRFFDMNAKRLSFGDQDNMYDFKNSPPLSSFFGAVKFQDPLAKMANATRRDSLKAMAQFSEFSSD